MAQHHETADRLTQAERKSTPRRLERLSAAIRLRREARAYRRALARIVHQYPVTYSRSADR
jgi:hypothetical protein